MMGPGRDYSRDKEGIEGLTNNLGLSVNLAVCVKYLVKGSRGADQLQNLEIASWYLKNQIRFLAEQESRKRTVTVQVPYDQR